MNKDNILEMSRQENKNKDLVGESAAIMGGAIAGISMSVLCLVFYLAQIALQGNCNWGFFAIISFYNAVLNLIKGIKMSKKIIIVVGVVWLALTVLLSVVHIDNLIATSTIL
ncbi:MAG: DUF6442 family protein [Lachnospiraceae bacterium]|nr:DUF6442 family protein [Lachnospiraceae bacterium]